MLVATLLSLCAIATGAGIFEEMLRDDSPFADPESIERHLENMRKLNDLQSTIMGVKPTSHDQINFDAEPASPDQLPYLFEGDIILTEDQMEAILRHTEDQLWAKQGEKRFRRSMTSSLYARWPAFPIPYFINTASGVSESAVLAGIARWETDTCITFKRQYNKPYGNGIEFFLGNGCYSMIGKVGSSSQQISIGNGCTSLGTVTHEIGHALGFYHEQGRYDRDAYVSIVSSNIQNGYLSQFTKQVRSAMEDYGVGYDYGSVMHYDQFSFSSNGRYTIQAADPNYQQTIGQRDGPSFMDVKRINSAYCNEMCSSLLPCLNGGYTDPKNCNACRCPTGFGGVLCERAASNPAQCGSGDRQAEASMKSISISGNVTCFFVIKAPANRRIYFEVPTFKFTSTNLCTYNFLEIKYAADLQRTGARFCLSQPQNSYSESDTLVILYKGSLYTSFTMNYRYDPPGVVTSPATMTTTRATMSSTKISASTSRTWATPTTSTRITTIQPTITTTVKLSNCSDWSLCSAPCGGCGVTTRTCSGVTERTYCNKQPCKFNFCCRPFLYVNQGFCFHPYYDEQLTKNTEDRMKLLEEYNNSQGVQVDGSGEF